MPVSNHSEQYIAGISYQRLAPAQRQQVNDFFVNSLPMGNQRPEVREIAKEFSTKKADISTASMLFYTTNLLKIDPTMFSYLSPEQLKSYQDSLKLAYYHLCQQYQSDKNESRLQHLETYFGQIEKCVFLIRNIEHAINHTQLEACPVSTKKGLLRELFDAELNFMSGKSVYVRNRMGDFNYWRLYWVWTGILLRTSMSMISDTFYNITQTKSIATDYQNIWGYISWNLYFARLFINFALVLKHSIPSKLWMTKEEIDLVRQNGLVNRFIQQANARKFVLINDFIWGLTNMMTHLWWVGPGIFGYAGNVATALLLAADLMLTMLRRSEDQASYNQDIVKYISVIDDLRQRLNDVNLTEDEKQTLQCELSIMIEAYEHCVINWRHKERGLNIDRVFAGGLLFSFVILCSCLIPDGVLSATASTALGLTGAGLLFSVSLVYSIYKGYMEVCKAHDAELRALLKCKQILAQPTRDLLTILSYNQNFAESEYQNQLAQYQMNKLIRSVIVEAMFPVMMFTAFTFLSFGIAAAIMATGIFIAVVSNLVIDHYKPTGPARLSYVDADLNNQQPEIEKRIEKAKPAKLMQWLFHSPEELGNPIKPSLATTNGNI